MNTTGNLTVGGDSDFTGFLQVGGYLTVDGNADFRGNVSFTQNCASGDNFQCGMPAAFDCDTTITGKLIGNNAEFSSDLIAHGNVSLGDGCGKTLTINATTTFNCDVNFNVYPLTIESAEIGELVVTGNTTLGNSCVNDTLNIESKTFLKCNTEAQAELRTKTDFVSEGPSYFQSLITAEDLQLNQKGTSKSTVSGDPGQTLCTKDYMEDYVNNYTTEWTQSGITVHTTVPNLHVNPNYGTGTIGTILDPWVEAHINNLYPDSSATGILGTQAFPWNTSYVRTYNGETLDLSGKGYTASTQDSDPANTLVTKDWILNKIPDVGNGRIRVFAGDGLNAFGDNGTANQFDDTDRYLEVKIKNNTLGVDQNGLFVIPGNLGLTSANNGQINFNAGNGLTSTGQNATANQGGNTTKTFTVQASNDTISVGTGGISVATGKVDTVSKISCVNTGGTAADPAIRTTRTGRDAGTEEVQIVGGTNISVTRNSGGKLTIANTQTVAASLWQVNSGALRPVTANQNVKPNGTATLGLSTARWNTVYATTTNTVNLTGCTVTGNLIPDNSAAHNLGSDAKRWKNLYTSDLHLSNEHLGGNDIDGTWGDWTIKEGENELYVVNNRSGQKFKMALIPF